ncbi:MAG: BrnT family toxin [Armatimonadetes bacterium]|nr:BrnT family toxin [Armatimonadota bacterium]
MAPIIEEFRVSDAARRHILVKHGVDPEDAIEAAGSTSRHYRLAAGPTHDRRYAIAGKTEDGRRIWVFYDNEGGRTGRIVSAREARGQQDVAHHKRMRGD